ncbi:MAG: AAA family ATPase, partial [Acidobacteria bacterium]|nr:AAA family ATPase [Acidobacteriota bacterium]
MFLKILSHPVFVNLNFHMPMLVDLSHPLILLTGENGCGKSTLLYSISYALQDKEIEGFVYRLENRIPSSKVFLFDAEQHNPRIHLDLFDNNPRMKEFVQ